MKGLIFKFRFFAVLFGCVVTVPVAHALEVSASIGRNPIFLDESVNLVVTAKDDSTNLTAPKTEPLRKDFVILQQSTQTNINIVNNSPHITQSWTYEIQPKRLGVVEIPSLSVSGTHTEPIELLVEEFTGNVTTAGAEIFLEVDVSSDNLYVQSQLNFTTRLYYSIPIVSGRLSPPYVPFATIEGSPQEKRYSSRRDGIDYRVIERRNAIFPHQSGSFTIPPIEFSGTIKRINPYTKTDIHLDERYSSIPVQIDVRPIPRSFSGSTWLPAQDLKLQDSWYGNAPEFTAGKPESRVITVDAVGLKSVQLPLTSYEENDTVRIYAGNNSDLKSSPNFEWVESRRTDEFAIIPQSGGTVEVPAFEVVWWDVNEDREKVAVLPAISAPMSQRASANLTDITGNFELEDSGSSATETFSAAPPQDQRWKWISLGLLVMWVITLLTWIFSRRFRRNQAEIEASIKEKKLETERQTLKLVRQACQDENVVEIGHSLLNWAAIHWPNRPPRNVVDIGRRLGSSDLIVTLEALDRANYSADNVSLSGRTVWQTLKIALESEYKPRKIKKRNYWFGRRETELVDLWPV